MVAFFYCVWLDHHCDNGMPLTAWCLVINTLSSIHALLPPSLSLSLSLSLSPTRSQGYGEVIDDEEDDDEGMDDLMQNPEFLHSVLSNLPGVNPEEALQNLEQMKDQQQKDKKKVQVIFDCILAISRIMLGKVRYDPVIYWQL